MYKYSFLVISIITYSFISLGSSSVSHTYLSLFVLSSFHFCFSLSDHLFNPSLIFSSTTMSYHSRTSSSSNHSIESGISLMRIDGSSNFNSNSHAGSIESSGSSEVNYTILHYRSTVIHLSYSQYWLFSVQRYRTSNSSWRMQSCNEKDECDGQLFQDQDSQDPSGTVINLLY